MKWAQGWLSALPTCSWHNYVSCKDFVKVDFVAIISAAKMPGSPALRAAVRTPIRGKPH